MQKKPSDRPEAPKAGDVLERYKYLLDMAFEAAQLPAAPRAEAFLLSLRSEPNPAVEPKLHKLKPWPGNQMNPHQAMEELERVSRTDRDGMPSLVGLPGLPLFRYDDSALARIEPADSQVRNKKLLRRDARYWSAYHYAVDLYRETYFSRPGPGRPSTPDDELYEIFVLRHEKGLSLLGVAQKRGEPTSTFEEKLKSKDKIRHRLRRAEKRFGDKSDKPQQ